MKPRVYIIILTVLLLAGLDARANTLNEAVKEARKQGQVLSAKTRQGMHEIRVVTPRGSVKTIRKPATENSRTLRQPESNGRFNDYQRRPEPSRQQIQKPEDQRSREAEFQRFNRPPQSHKPRMTPKNVQPPRTHRPTQPRRRPPARQRSDDHDPD